jgi:putative solute:sodium symporter small subunit
MAQPARPQEYWKYNVRLTTFTLIVWFVVTYVAIFFAPQLNNIVILGFPMGYYMGAQGSLIVFVWLIFNYAFKMNKADIEYGVEEEE